MTLNATGPISLGGSTAGQSINLELGQAATAQVSMNDANVRSLAGVPSGAISMPTNFYGKSNIVVAISNQTISDILVANPASAAYQLLSTGVAQSQTNSGTTFLQNWITPQTGMSGYEARATLTGSTGAGTLNGTLNTWLNLGTTRTWELTETANIIATCTLTIEIGVAGSGTAITSASILLRARST